MSGKGTILVSFACIFTLLAGCKQKVEFQSDIQNVEQRDYATILLVAEGKSGKEYEFSVGIAEEKKVGEKSQTEKVSTFYANDLEEFAKEYQSVKGKSLSLVHLKVVLLARQKEEVLGSQWDILNQLDENAEIAKTCPIVQIIEKDKFMEFIKKAKEPVGTYISNLIEIKESEGDGVPWLKDYMKMLREGTKLQVYFLEDKTEGWQLNCREEIEFSL